METIKKRWHIIVVWIALVYFLIAIYGAEHDSIAELKAIVIFIGLLLYSGVQLLLEKLDEIKESL